MASIQGSGSVILAGIEDIVKRFNAASVASASEFVRVSVPPSVAVSEVPVSDRASVLGSSATGWAR